VDKENCIKTPSRDPGCVLPLEEVLEKVFSSAVTAYMQLENRSPMSNQEGRDQLISEALKKRVYNYQERITVGVQCIYDELTRFFPESAKKMLVYISTSFSIPGILTQEKNRIESHDWEEVMAQVWLLAKSLYEQAHPHVCNIYLFLSVIEPLRPNIWIALGHCQMALCELEQASISYSIASALNPENPSSLFYLAHCFEQRGLLIDALSALEKALQLSYAFPKDNSYTSSIESYLQVLKNRKISHNSAWS
jgi:tetratricopeptide (TPR) repeat protein